MRKIDSKYKTEIEDACIAALYNVGFTRFRKTRVDWPLDEKFNCWVGLNFAVDPKWIELNPFVGVHAIELMKFRASGPGLRTRPIKYDRGTSTYSIHFGELLPHEKMFRFTEETDIDEEAQRLAQIYVKHGLKFAQSIASYAALLPLLLDKISVITLGGYPELAACCLFLMGDRAGLREFVENFIQNHQRYLGSFDDTFMRSLTEIP